MSVDIKRIQRWRTGRTERERTHRAPSADLPLDHQLTFQPDPTEQWTFRNGRIFVNGEDANELINEHGNDISFLTDASVGIELYKQYVWKGGGHGRGKFNAAVNALQGKIAGRLGSIYEGLVGGVRYEFADETLWINNVNVQAVITLYRLRPTVQAREYLKGLRTKLFLIIARQQSNPRVNGIHSVVSKYIGEINVALEMYCPADTPLLVADTRREHERAG